MRIVFGSGNSQYRGYADKIGIDFDKKNILHRLLCFR